jgi:hypothetical protein
LKVQVMDAPLDLARTKTVLTGAFRVSVMGTLREGTGFAFNPRKRGEVKVAADTLKAMLEPNLAVLYQREAKPFTLLDLALRSKVVGLYDKMPPTRSAPIPEPRFEIEK